MIANLNKLTELNIELINGFDNPEAPLREALLDQLEIWRWFKMIVPMEMGSRAEADYPSSVREKLDLANQTIARIEQHLKG